MGRLRIIGGEHRGRLIRVPGIPSVRPTPDRVREALFSILGPDWEGRILLDAFAGSGAIGLESLSRGAERAVFVESDPRALRVLRENVALLGLEARSVIVPGDVSRQLVAGSHRLPRVDVAVADPPYGSMRPEEFLEIIEKSRLLRSGGSVVFQRDRGPAPGEALPGPYRLVRSYRYGRTWLDLFVRGLRAPAARP